MNSKVPIWVALNESGVSASKIADTLGVSKAYLNKYISRPSEISIANAMKISRLTGRKLDDLDFGIISGRSMEENFS